MLTHIHQLYLILSPSFFLQPLTITPSIYPLMIPEFNSNLKLYGIIHTSHVLIGFSRLFFFTHF